MNSMQTHCVLQIGKMLLRTGKMKGNLPSHIEKVQDGLRRKLWGQKGIIFYPIFAVHKLHEELPKRLYGKKYGETSESFETYFSFI